MDLGDQVENLTPTGIYWLLKDAQNEENRNTWDFFNHFFFWTKRSGSHLFLKWRSPMSLKTRAVFNGNLSRVTSSGLSRPMCWNFQACFFLNPCVVHGRNPHMENIAILLVASFTSYLSIYLSTCIYIYIYILVSSKYKDYKSWAVLILGSLCKSPGFSWNVNFSCGMSPLC